MAVGHGKRIVGGEAIALLYQYGTDTEAEMANICANHRGGRWVTHRYPWFPTTVMSIKGFCSLRTS